MNITIEARALAAASGGVKTYTHELITHLIKLYPNEAFEIIYGSQKPLGMFPSSKETHIPLHSELLLSYWMSAQLSRHIRNTKPSVVHYTKAAIPNTKSAPTVVTIYDIIPILMPETQSPLRRLYWPHVLEHAAKTADHIMTISQGSKRDIMEHFHIPEERITVTPLAVDLMHFTPLRSSSSAGQAPYILFVGTRDARKNIPSLISAFAQISDRIPHQLVIVGKAAKKQDRSKQAAVSLELQDRVEFREDVTYAQLPALYSGADIFVWPSKYEGWGFPPQEAMASGTPVIVSDGTPLPEVVGDAGIIIPLEKDFVDHLAHEMLALIQDEPKKAKLIAKGLARVQQFSWEDVARATYDVYKKVAV